MQANKLGVNIFYNKKNYKKLGKSLDYDLSGFLNLLENKIG